MFAVHFVFVTVFKVADHSFLVLYPKSGSQALVKQHFMRVCFTAERQYCIAALSACSPTQNPPIMLFYL